MSINRKSNYKKYSFVLGLFYLIFFVSFGTFVVKPRWFYWRAWEFFEEIAYWIPHKNKWKDYEMGDVERTQGKSYYKKHLKWRTVVSCNDQGGRSIPIKSENYAVVFGGDSQTWGSGLSDSQTIPWKVAKKLSLPVYNAAKFPFTIQKGLKNPYLVNAKILVEIPVRAHLDSSHFAVLPQLGKEDPRNYFHGYTNPRKRHIFNYAEIHPKRYFLPAKLLRSIKLEKGIEFLCKGFLPCSKAPKQSLPEVHREDGIRKIAEGIKARAQAFEEMGYIYIFGVIPGKHIIDVKYLDESTTKLDQLLKELLIESGVHYVDIPSCFREHPLRRELYIPTDTHVNEYGAELIAVEISRYIEENFGHTLEGLRNLNTRKSVDATLVAN